MKYYKSKCHNYLIINEDSYIVVLYMKLEVSIRLCAHGANYILMDKDLEESNEAEFLNAKKKAETKIDNLIKTL